VHIQAKYFAGMQVADKLFSVILSDENFNLYHIVTLLIYLHIKNIPKTNCRCIYHMKFNAIQYNIINTIFTGEVCHF